MNKPFSQVAVSCVFHLTMFSTDEYEPDLTSIIEICACYFQNEVVWCKNLVFRMTF